MSVDYGHWVCPEGLTEFLDHVNYLNACRDPANLACAGALDQGLLLESAATLWHAYVCRMRLPRPYLWRTCPACTQLNPYPELIRQAAEFIRSQATIDAQRECER